MSAPHLPTARPEVGRLIRAWREKRRLSQMALALDAEVSTRHLSYVETGRSRPSPALVLALAEQLQVPLRERNQWLLAAGYAPRYTQTPMSAPDLASVKQGLQRLLDAHDPYPGVALDRHWNLVLGNRAAAALADLLPPALRGPPLNMLRASLHPQGFAAYTENFDDWGSYLLGTIDRADATQLDPTISALRDEVNHYPNVQALRQRSDARQVQAHAASQLLVPCVMRLLGARVSLFTTLATLGAPRDVTLDELTVELFYPSDEASAAVLRAWAAPQNAG